MNIENERLTLREVQLEELSILLKVKKFFEDNDIHYMLCGGTLLGAVRHKGFIPWDDDIDVCMLRDDFERLKAIIRDTRPNLDGVIFHLPGDDGYIYPYIKAVNQNIIADYGKDDADNLLWIDIFSLDHFPDNKFMHWLYLQRLITLVRALSIGTYSDENMRVRGYYSSPVKRIKMFIARSLYRLFGGSRKISQRMDRISRSMDKKYKSSQHVGGSWPIGMHDYYPLESMQSVTQVSFEGYEFNAPQDYDAFLTACYGDYMTLPPVDKRQTHYLTAYRVN